MRSACFYTRLHFISISQAPDAVICMHTEKEGEVKSKNILHESCMLWLIAPAISEPDAVFQLESLLLCACIISACAHL
jgi:hypothetical protein